MTPTAWLTWWKLAGCPNTLSEARVRDFPYEAFSARSALHLIQAPRAYEKGPYWFVCRLEMATLLFARTHAGKRFALRFFSAACPRPPHIHKNNIRSFQELQMVIAQILGGGRLP